MKAIMKNVKKMLNNIYSIRKIFIIFILTISFTISSGLTKQQAIQQLVIFGTLNNHYSPKNIDDNYSKEVFNYYLKRLDPSKRIFTQEDILKLSRYKYAIDDNIEEGSFAFYDDIQQTYKKRINFLKRNIPKSLKKPFSFNENEFLETDTDKRDYSKNEKELKEYWRKSLKYQVLTKYISLKESKVSNNSTIDISFDAKLEKEARKKVQEDFYTLIDRLKNENNEEQRDYYIDTLINVFDIHTSYFPPAKKEDFDINISGKLEGIGAVLGEEDGFIKVIRIVPGSASWKQGELKAEDLILKVAQGDKEPIDIVGSRVKDAVKLIRGKKGSEVRLTVKHVTGETAVIPIIRDIVTIEETYTKYAVIDDKRYGKRFGYISVPKFYRDFKNAAGKNTTDDVRNALNELKLQQVSGILLDLRNNEGGALVDAVNTAGLFIEKGPIVQVKGLRETVLKDRDPSVLFNGPLVILINNYSASASEILAAALQDFNRAVIVGSNSFGKGTVQTFVDLDRFNPTKTAIYNPMGSLKLTIQKFYRITGDSTQNKGVIPDIVLPDAYQHLDVGEKHLDYALPFDTTKATRFVAKNAADLNLSFLQAQSESRIKESEHFQNLIKHISFIKKKSYQTRISLSADKAIKEKIQTTKASDSYEDSVKELSFLSFNLPQEKYLNEAQKESYSQWTNGLKKDLYIMESCSILNNLFNSNTLAIKSD